MKKILITGVVGFIGYHLARRLLERGDCFVVGIDNLSRSRIDRDFEELRKKYQKSFQFFQADARYGWEPASEIEEVYHLAAYRTAKYSMEEGDSPIETLKNNIESTMAIVRNFSNARTKVLFASTGEVWGSISRGSMVSEDAVVGVADLHDPRWTYAASKIVGEMAMIHGLENFVIVRMQNPYGPRMGWDNVVPRFMRSILDGEKTLYVATPNDSRPFTYIDDVIADLILLMESPKSKGQIYNVASSAEYSIGRLARELVAISGRTVEIEEEEEVDRVENRGMNTEKIERLRGFSKFVRLEEGLAETFMWYNKNYEQKKV